MSSELVITTAAPDEVVLAVDWAAREGWNPGLTDADAFRSADPEGFLIGRVDSEPVSVISAVRYGDDLGFIGLYIVRPEWRGQGRGLAIWDAAMARLAGRTVGLDGVVAQQANYARSGFVLAHRNVRYSGTPLDGVLPDDPSVTLLGPEDARAIGPVDRACFGAHRTAFLQAWLGLPGALAVGLADRSGYGVVRPCRRGWKVGPLFASTPDGAAALLGRLLRHVPAGEAVALDVPVPHGNAVALAEGVGLAPVFETARMYRGPAPDLPLERIWGITTFELG